MTSIGHPLHSIDESSMQEESELNVSSESDINVLDTENDEDA